MRKFSVFLPVRNGWPYVEECVTSILGQTYPHFELHVLDNQSTDNTVSWLKSVKDERLHLWSSPVSLSIQASWDRVKGLPKQEFMTLLGHDDTLDPDFLAATNALIERHPSASLYQTGARLINTRGRTIRSCWAVPERETGADYLKARFTFRRDAFGTGYVMRSADYDRLGGIPPFERLFFADDALWLSLLRNSYKAADPAEHVAVRIHPRSESASLPSAWASILNGLNQFTDFLARFAAEDDDLKAVVAEVGSAFVLEYHRNIYIFALVDACRRGVKLEPSALRCIETSLAASASAAAGQLRHAAKVRLVESINSTALRRFVPQQWRVYNVLRTRSL